MKFKLTLTIIGCLLILNSCKNQEPDEHNPETVSASEFPSEPFTESGNTDIDSSKTESASKTDAEDPSMTFQGQYIKVGEEADLHCGCYCLDLNFTSNSELCLSPDKIYINVKFEKADSNLIHVYFADASDINAEGVEIPWEKFDRNIPIASLTPQANGELDLDWLGFSINGELAMDYAIFGKKTLEGTFKRK